MSPIHPSNKINCTEKKYINQIHHKLPEIAYQSVFSKHMKNCDPFVLGPEFAMERVPERDIHYSNFVLKSPQYYIKSHFR